MAHESKKHCQEDKGLSAHCNESEPGNNHRCGLSGSPLSTILKFWGNDRYKAASVCVFLFLAVALVFGQTLSYEFVNYDDDLYVYENPHVTGGFSADSLVWAFTTGHGRDWHPWYPLAWLSFMLDSQLFGLHAGGYHLTNVLLHAGAAILLFLVLWRMMGFLWRSAFVAAVFAVHPLRVESVAWVVERRDVLSGLFFMLTLGAYVGYVRRPFSLVRYLLVIVSFGLGLMAKMMLVTLPFVLLLLDYWPLGRMGDPHDKRAFHFPWLLLVEKIPLFAMAAALSVATPFANINAIPVTHRITNAFVSYMAYIGKFFYPVGLAVFYPHPGGSLPIWSVIISALGLALISAAALVWWRRIPYFFVGWFWYLGMMFPTIGLVLIGLQGMADRYTYLPQIGLCLSLTWGLTEMTVSWRYRRWLCGVASTLAILVLMGLAWLQTSSWRNSETLWTHALKCTTNNARAHYNLGVTLSGLGRIDEAIVHYRRALEIKPNDPGAHNNLGMALSGLGRTDEAMAHYRKALEIKPYSASVYNNLGNVMAGRGEIDGAIAHYRKALEIDPDFAEAHMNLADNLARRGQMDEAISHFQRTIEINPYFTEAHISLGHALAGRGQIDEAITHFRKALEIRPGNALVHNSLGVALASCGRIDEAIVHFQKALQIKPDYTEVLENLDLAIGQREKR